MPVNSAVIKEIQTIETRQNSYEATFGAKKSKKMIHGGVSDVGLSSMEDILVPTLRFILSLYLKASFYLFNLLNSCKHPEQVSRSISHSTKEKNSSNFGHR
jgi:hypothetical protein